MPKQTAFGNFKPLSFIGSLTCLDLIKTMAIGQNSNVQNLQNE